MDYFIIYREKEIIEGPLRLEQARAVCEDLDMAFANKGYRVVHQNQLVELGLRGEGKYHIQEDIPNGWGSDHE